MSERVQTLTACDDCGRGYRACDLVWWPYLALWLCVECATKRRQEMGDE